jgi:hypothetical protein
VAFVGVVTSGSIDTDALLRSMQRANREVGRRLATGARTAQNAAIRAGSPSRLRNMRVTLASRTRVFAGPQSVTTEVRAHPPGPWAIAETGRGAVRARGRALAIPGHPRASARATRGRPGTWDAATARATPELERIVVDVYDDVLEV